MTCGNCARHVNQALMAVSGVRGATVSLEAHVATVQWAPNSNPDFAALVHAVEAQGYGAKVIQQTQGESSQSKLAGWRLNLLLGVPVTVLLMIGEWGFRLGLVPWFRWTAFGLAGVVQLFAGARFYRGAWLQLKAGSSNMDTLVALGSTTAFAYSTWALLADRPGHVYFMEAAAIITLISVGHWAESLVSVRASAALRKLLNLAPAMARQRLSDGTERVRPVSELSPGDLVVLRPGDHVPTDGEVVGGTSALDEAMLTGESVPVDKAAGNPVFAGTVNLNGSLVMRVTAIGEETALSHIIAAVQRAQNSRAQIQRLGDRVSSIFVPLVVAVALAAGLWWALAPDSARLVHTWVAHYAWLAEPPAGRAAAAFMIASAVLIVACPCAMGLATPAAIMAGANAAAQRGILVRDGIALEKAGKVSAVVFDKTGTLTTGKPEVISFWTAVGDETSPSQLASTPASAPAPVWGQLLDLAIALASHSNHPVSQAVSRLRASSSLVTDWEEIHGSGVQGRRAGQETKQAEQANADPQTPVAAAASFSEPLARLGSLRWLKCADVDLAPGKDFIEKWSAQGATLVGLADGPQLQGLFAVKDSIKPGAAAVIGELNLQGLKIFLVTGDNSLTATSIGRQVGIPPEKIFAEVRPQEKAEFVTRLQTQGERVAFVGDGINDAPALEQAELGIAVSRASDIAREAADIILLNSEIEAVPESLGLARATLRVIKQNLFWAFFYNVASIPLAALGFMSPILCAAAMGMSDLVVIGNALRLRNWRLQKRVSQNPTS